MATSQKTIRPRAGLSPDELKRIARSTSTVERSRPSGSRPIYDRARWTAVPYGAIRTCVISSDVTARSGDVLGTGEVTFLVTDAETGEETVSADGATVYNSFATGFSADEDKRYKIHWEGGLWKILTGEC